MRKFLIIAVFMLAGCGGKNLLTVQYFDSKGSITKVETREMSDTATAIHAQMVADEKYFAQPETVKVNFTADTKLKSIVFSQAKSKSSYRIPLTGAEIAGNIVTSTLSPANILGTWLGLTAFKQAENPSSQSVVNTSVGGDQSVSAAEVGSSPSTIIQPGVDRSSEVITEDAYNDVYTEN